MSCGFNSTLSCPILVLLIVLVVVELSVCSAVCPCPTQAENNNQNSAVTSFEDLPVGPFETLSTNVGTWEAIQGSVAIDGRHAKTGKQCLQLSGMPGEAVVDLVLGTSVRQYDRLTFWAERWTSRKPFSFQIAKFSRGRWTEFYDGSQEIKVGRSFKSRIELELDDSAIRKIRFKIASPADTGILIDDLAFSKATKQDVVSMDVVPVVLPALVGTASSPIAKVNVKTSGTLKPVSVVGFDVEIPENSLNQLESVQVMYSASSSRFQSGELFGSAWFPNGTLIHKFVGRRELLDGDNVFWFVGRLKKTADIDKPIGIKVKSMKLSNGKIARFKNGHSSQRTGIALRKGGDDGCHTYRIPGLATTNAGSLIAVYDVRWKSRGDLPGHIDVGMSRSTDGGRTWDPMKVIMDMGKDPKWLGDGVGDPAILVDRETGTIWVAATWSHGNRSWRGSGPGLEPEQTGQWMMVKSEDDGLSWSDPINITSQVKKTEWCFLLQGPGKGVCMSNGTLVFPAQFQDTPDNNRLPRSSLIYSRDHGKNWQMGNGAWDDTTESQIIELSDGLLMINCRTNRSSKRAVLTSRDMGKSWLPHPSHEKELIEPGACMASLINVDRELSWRNLEVHQPGLLLFSNPNSKRGRSHITIKASKDGGISWPENWQLLLDEDVGAGYSCMSMIDSETVGILYEGSQADMTFQRVKITEILK